VMVGNYGQMLKPHMFARAEIVTGTVEDAMVVPRQAVVTREGQPSIVRVVDGEAEVVPVKVGATYNSLVVVNSPALKPSDRVIVEGQEIIATGQKVTIA